MKELKDTRLFVMSDLSIPNMLDNEIQTVEIRCPCCGRYVRLTEAYINECQQHEIEEVIHKLNSFIGLMDEAIIDIYGEDDIRIKYLMREFDKIKKKHFAPNLKVVK